MNLRLLKTVSFFSLLAAPVLLSAQSENSAKEEERLAELARSENEIHIPKTKVSIGFRVLNSGGRVNFSNLGGVASIRNIAPISDGAVTREYDNGKVTRDALRTNETSADGSQGSTPGSRYLVPVTDSNGAVVNYDILVSYTPGYTRQWYTLTEQQLDRSGYASFNTYHTTSDGASASHEKGVTGGVEFQITRDLGQSTGTFQWGIVAGITLNDINGKSAGTVSSTLHTHTDYYAYTLNNQSPPSGTYYAPSQISLPDSNGNTYNYETTVLLSEVPDAVGTDTAVLGGANVTGNWQVKGAYLMVRLGPSLRAQLTERLALTASLGLAGAYAGTRYSAYEYFTNPDQPEDIIATEDPVSSDSTEFLHGYFADLNLEWAANETVGLYGGVTAQQLNDYVQKLGERSAKVDLGSSVGMRGGISIRF